MYHKGCDNLTSIVVVSINGTYHHGRCSQYLRAGQMQSVNTGRSNAVSNYGTVRCSQ